MTQPAQAASTHVSWKKRAAHYLEIFAAAFAVTALVNADHLLAAHGLDALKSAGVALVVAAVKAGVDALRGAVVKTA